MLSVLMWSTFVLYFFVCFMFVCLFVFLSAQNPENSSRLCTFQLRLLMCVVESGFTKPGNFASPPRLFPAVSWVLFCCECLLSDCMRPCCSLPLQFLYVIWTQDALLFLEDWSHVLITTGRNYLCFCSYSGLNVEIKLAGRNNFYQSKKYVSKANSSFFIRWWGEGKAAGRMLFFFILVKDSACLYFAIPIQHPI